VCFSKGRFWPVSVPAKAGVASQKTQQNWAQFGMYESGDTVLSVPNTSPIYGAGQFDRLVALDATEQFSVNLIRGTKDRLLQPVQTITRVFWLNPALTQTIDGRLPVVAADGTLSWPAGGGPPANTAYSVSGTQFQEFCVFMDYPSNRNEHDGAPLPKRIVARRFSIMNR
jgi:hypothetical protein